MEVRICVVFVMLLTVLEETCFAVATQATTIQDTENQGQM